MIETEQQRRWWFATHPEFSWHQGEDRRNSHDGDEEDDSGRPSPERVDEMVDERLQHETDNVRRTILKLTKYYFGTEFQSKTPVEKEAILREDQDDEPVDNEPPNAAGNDWWSQQPKEPEATIGPPKPPGFSDGARYVLDFLCPGLIKAYDRWRIGYYDAYPWAPGPLYDALGDLGGLVAFGLMRIQTALAKAASRAEIAALQNARQELLKIWDYANFPRGWAMDDHLGWNLPRTFKGIDFYESSRHRSTPVWSTYGEVWRGDESPLQIMAQHGALPAPLSEAKPRSVGRSRGLSWFVAPRWGMDVGMSQGSHRTG
jgi:hypothetical protein